jgi:hypothetical protein
MVRFAALVVLVFLGSLRSTFIAAIAIRYRSSDVRPMKWRTHAQPHDCSRSRSRSVS